MTTTLKSLHLAGCARCPAAGLIRQALNKAVRLVEREFPRGGSCQNTFHGANCLKLRKEFDDRKVTILEGRSEKDYRVLNQMLKSCNRFFDVSCRFCDKRAARDARDQWQRDVARDPDHDPAAPASWSGDPIGELARRVRCIVGPDWAKGLVRPKVYVPCQKGCLEKTQGEGGTLAARPSRPRELFPTGRGTDYSLRVGVCKTKGKFRVVTMQSERVKEVLSPLHEHLYDFLSQRRWLVRGEVNPGHIKDMLESMRPGENIISGDYKAATNNIYLPAVKAIVDVLAEAPSLTPEERATLVKSFEPENLRWRSRSGVLHPIKRGSMMGNLMSFNILCLLNKACFDIVSSLRCKRGDRPPVGTVRRPAINGDDIAFTGDRRTYEDWRSVTSHFGLVVNEDKTGVSQLYAELNSRSFQCRKRKGVWTVRALRKPVLSCLLRDDNPSCLLTRLWEGLRTCSPATLRQTIIESKDEIMRRGVTLSALPSRLRRVLLKMAWFRSAIFAQPVIIEHGVKRSPKIVKKSCRPADSQLAFYDECCERTLRCHVAEWRGVCLYTWDLEPYRSRLSRARPSYRRAAEGRISFRTRWEWLWPEPVWRYFDTHGLPTTELGSQRWEDDHRDLSVSVDPIITHPGYAPPPCLLSGVNIEGFLQFPNGSV